MKNVVWASNTVSVIVLPSGQDGEELLEIAKQWTASFVLGPALWVQDHHIPEDTGEAPDVKAFVLGRNKIGEPENSLVNLFWALGSQEFSLVRILAVRSEQSPEVQAATTSKVRLLEKYLDASRPSLRGLDKSKPIGTQMVKLNLVFSSTGDSKRIPQSVIEPSWDANIVAAPEDRPTPGSFDAFAQKNHRYYGFVLAHIATAAGIWAGLPKSTYEMGGDHATANRARFQRVFIRAVATDKLSGDLAKWALEKAATPDSEATLGRIAGRQIAAVRTGQIPEKIDELVEHLMSGTGGDDFKYRPIPGAGWRAEPKTSLLKKLTIRIADFAEGLKFIPKYLFEVVNQRIDKDPNEEESIGYLPKRLDPRFNVADTQEVINQPRPKVEPSSFALWQHVRETFSSSLDSPSHFHLPKALDAGDGKRLILGDTSSVFPDPASSWEESELALASGISLDRVSWIDAASAKEQLNKVIEKGIELKPGMDEARDEVKEIREQFEKYVIAEKEARIALKQVEVELKEDIIFAEKIRKQHPHNLPKDIVGEPRETVLLPGENLDEDSNEPDPKDGTNRDDGDVNPDGDSSNG
jgi:hypothetical protein